LLTPEERKKYVSGWLKRQKEKEEQLRRQRQLAVEKASQIARMLKVKYGAKKVILFGSLAYGSTLWSQSDIDIAVEGIDEEKYLDIAWEAAQIALPFKVDLVPLERASESLKAKIERKGIDL